ncbi:MAG: bifunctional UDP-N-acetylglucosamine diphosphorylase/glucosamine-1-phosphate N-acetyltransferase GlmU, partial [Peptostreptococcales bacterium]
MKNNTAVILAAGAGTRMKSNIPKVLHKLCGYSMINHVISTVKDSGIEDIIVVVGNGADQVKEELEKMHVTFAIQTELLGTAHAVLQAEESIPDGGNTVVLCGDMPLIKESTLKTFIEYHHQSGNSVSVLTAIMEDPFGYGRIIKDEKGNLLKIVEEKDGTEEELKTQEVNSGVYCFDTAFLKDNLKNVDNNNNQREYYLPDLVAIAVKDNCKVNSYLIDDSFEIMGINNRVQLAEAERIMRYNIVEEWMIKGVTFIDPDYAYIDKGVSIGRDTCIFPGVILSRQTRIGENCIIGQNSRIENSIIENDVEIQNSVILDSQV